MVDEPAGSLRPNNGDHDATRIDCRDVGSAPRLHPGVRTRWRDGQPESRFRRDLAAWHGTTWFAWNPQGATELASPGLNPAPAGTNRGRERHDTLGHGESVIGNIRLEHKLRRRRTGV